MATENIDIIVKEIGAQQTADAIARVGDGANKAVPQLNNMNSAIEQVKATLVSLGVLLSAKQALSMADDYTILIDKLRKYSSSNEELIATEGKLNEIALATRQRMDEVASVYASMAKASAGAGVEQKTLMEATMSVSKAMTASHQSAGDAGEVFKRLAFSLQSGLMPGRAIAQLFLQFPILGAAIAKELNVSSKEFLRMAHDGQLSMKQIVDAMASAGAAGKSLDTAFNNTTVTLASAFERLGGQVSRSIGLFDQASGTSRVLANSVLFLGTHIDDVLAIVRAFTVGLGAYAIATYAASAGTVTLTGALTTLVAIISRPAVLIAAAAAAISLLITYFKDFKLTTDGSVTALGAVVGAFNLLKAAVMTVWESALKPFITWVKDTPAALTLLSGALIGLGVVLAGTFSLSIISAVVSFGGAIGALAASVYALLVPVGLFVLSFAAFVAAVYLGAAAVHAFTDATGITKGALAGFNANIEATAINIKNKMGTAFTEATDAVKKHALAQLDVKTKTDQATQSAADASQAWFRSSDAFKEVHKEANGASSAIDQLGESYLNGASDADKFAEASQRLMDIYSRMNTSSKNLAEQGQKVLEEQAKKTTDRLEKQREEVRRLAEEHEKELAATTGVAAALGMTQKEYDETHKHVGALNKDLEHGSVLWNEWATEAEKAADEVVHAAQRAYTGWKNASQGGIGSADSTVSFGFGPQNETTASADPATAISFAGQPGHQNYDPWYIATFGNTTTQASLDSFRMRHGLSGSAGGFASGGSFTVGGSGGSDSQLVRFMASPDEQVTIRTPAQQRAANGGGSVTVVNMHVHGVEDMRGFNRNSGQIASKLRSQLSRRT